MTTSSSLRSRAVLGGCALLLAGPTVIGFFTGGYFASPRDCAGAIAWLLVAVAALLGKRVIPDSRGGRLALAGVVLLAAWTFLSTLWAPLASSAYQYGELAAMYAGVLIASAALIRGRVAQRAVAPALAAGTLTIIGYGLSERLLPGLLSFARSISAEGRLEQPLTYWNAMGEVAALGFVLCTSVAGDASRARWMRSAAAGATVPLGMGLYISFSRGALFACVAGLIALAVLVGRREQLRSIGCCLVAGVLASIAAAPMRGFGSLAGSLSTREQQGAIALAVIVVLGAAAAAVQWRLAREPAGELTFRRRTPWLALAAILVGLGIAIVVGAHEGAGTGKTLGSGASRLASLQSNRYAYWAVALRAFAAEPIHGVGAGGWAVRWLEHRHISESAQDAHSLELQTLAELGLVGFALLLTFVGGVGLAARDARRVAPVLAGGPIAGLVVYLAHSPLDWDWEMPAVTLIALVLAGAVIGLAELMRPARTMAGAPRPSGRGQTAIGA